MRPPLNAGENWSPVVAAEQSLFCFNEAPAERGGKRVAHGRRGVGRHDASMRPPLNAGENSVQRT